MKIENKPFTFFDYLDALKRRRKYWKKVENFHYKQNGDLAVALYHAAIDQAQYLEEEINKITKYLKV